MRDFTSTTDRALSRLLDNALAGRGAFRRFRDVLSEHPEALARWEVFSSERSRARARAWLSAKGYRPAVNRP
ncbi:MAG: UPF0158 family protein [Egibacteraceae bacterium]